jgi:endonuclease-8
VAPAVDGERRGRDARDRRDPAADGAVRRERRTWVFERSGRPCRRCGTLVEFRGQGDDNRNTFWCPDCQR